MRTTQQLARINELVMRGYSFKIEHLRQTYRSIDEVWLKVSIEREGVSSPIIVREGSTLSKAINWALDDFAGLERIARAVLSEEKHTE